MEPDVAVLLSKQLAANDIALDSLIADDDAATIKHIRKEVSGGVDKWSDLSHTKRTLAPS